jgi:hypothetical protein
VYDDVQQDVLAQLYHDQTVLIGEADDDPTINPFLFLIFEDCVDQNFRYRPEVERMFYAGRHFKACCLVTTQWFVSLHPGVRSNADVTFIFQLQSRNEIERVWEQYFGWFPKEEFPALLAKVQTFYVFHFATRLHCSMYSCSVVRGPLPKLSLVQQGTQFVTVYPAALSSLSMPFSGNAPQ